jgi:hypothetical protein
MQQIMLRFHVSICSGPVSSSLHVSFDKVAAELSAFPRLFIEPDGSFVWTGISPEGRPWQVDGNLIDRGDVLACVELKGCCPFPQFDALLRTLGWPDEKLLFQLQQHGSLLTENDFRQLAASERGAI